MTISAYYHCAVTHSLRIALPSNISVAHHEAQLNSSLVEAQHRLTVTRRRATWSGRRSQRLNPPAEATLVEREP